MAVPSQYGLSAGQYSPQPDFVARQAEQGGWVATQSYVALESSLSDTVFRNKFVAGASPRDLDPDIDSYWDFMGLTATDVEYMPGSWITIRVRYNGFSASGTSGPDAVQSKYELRADSATVSILKHPSVAGFSSNDRKVMTAIVNRDHDFFWDEENEEGKLRFYPFGDRLTSDSYDPQPSGGLPQQDTSPQKWAEFLVNSGITSYYQPSFTWTRSWQDSSGITSLELDNIGRVEAPEGNPPAPSPLINLATGEEVGRNWILEGAYQVQRGSLFYCSKRWVQSDQGGWPALVYGT